ncbi:MAG: TerD family protein, partial [Candidatus Limnocylindria bacterium]
SGVVQFDDMGPSWTSIRERARLHALRKTDADVGAVASRWDELMRFLSLELTKELGLDVREVFPRSEASGTARHQALRESLSAKGRLCGELRIPNTAGNLQIVADLGSRQIMVSTTIDAPREGLSRGRVGWLMRPLQKSPKDLTIEARLMYTSSTLTGQLGALQENNSALLPDKSREISGFRLSLTRDMGLNRSGGRNAFIDSVISTTKTYYREVLQNLTAWKPRAPRLPESATVPTQSDKVTIDDASPQEERTKGVIGPA